jgi:hypothetical protein
MSWFVLALAGLMLLVTIVLLLQVVITKFIGRNNKNK